jgi:ectoine hydroxylase-related dioxygenase (phytanoyl-CoA dioxygenase family)
VGLLPVHPASGPGGVGVNTDGLGLPWLAQDMAPGDCLFFHSHTIHRALPNVSEDRLRISVDFRYQGFSQPIVEDSLLPHYGRLTWDAIYQDWRHTELQYYWRRQPLTVVPRQTLSPVTAAERQTGNG